MIFSSAIVALLGSCAAKNLWSESKNIGWGAKYRTSTDYEFAWESDRIWNPFASNKKDEWTLPYPITEIAFYYTNTTRAINYVKITYEDGKFREKGVKTGTLVKNTLEKGDCFTSFEDNSWSSAAAESTPGTWPQCGASASNTSVHPTAPRA